MLHWLKRVLGPKVRIPATREPETEASPSTSSRGALSAHSDVEGYVAVYLGAFVVNVDYAGDQRDQRLLEKVRRDAGPLGSDLVLSVLLRGLELTQYDGDGSFQQLSFLDALGSLGDSRAIEPLRVIRASCNSPSARRAATLSLTSLGDKDWLANRALLERRAKQLIKEKIGKVIADEHWSDDATLVIRAVVLLERDGDFIAREKVFFGKGSTTFHPIIEPIEAKPPGTDDNAAA